MAERTRTDLTSDAWTPWIETVCTRLDLDPGVVDVSLIHDLTKQVAHRYERPMAPVSAHLIGIALGRALATDPDLDAAEMLRRLADTVEATLPPPA